MNSKNKSTSFLSNPKSISQASLMVLGIIFFILYFFEPFQRITHGNTLAGFLRMLSYAFFSALSFYLLESRCKPKQLKSYQLALWYGFELWMISIVIFILKNAWAEFQYLSFYEYSIVLYRVIIIGFVPILILFIIIYNKKLSNSPESLLNLQSQDQNPEYLKIYPQKLLALKSDQNYTTLYYLEEEKLNKKLLRGSLSFFESQLPSIFFRIHRSYIINLDCIQQVSGNSQGLSVKLENLEEVFKVSRKYKSDFEAAWQSLSH